MCRSLGKELRVLLGVAKRIVGFLLLLVWVLFSGFRIFCIYVIRRLHLSATPRNYSGTPFWVRRPPFCIFSTEKAHSIIGRHRQPNNKYDQVSLTIEIMRLGAQRSIYLGPTNNMAINWPICVNLWLVANVLFGFRSTPFRVKPVTFC